MTNRKKNISIISIVFLIVVALFSCEERSYYESPSATLIFSMDTISFDTVFTSVGSATLRFTVRNAYSEDLEINSISLEGGDASNFRINIDGAPENSISDKLLRAKDSMYIFVDVTVDATDKTLPFLIEDNILFNTNGKEQKVVLQANGQDAYHIKLGEWGDVAYQIIGEDISYFVMLSNDTILKNDKPYFLHDDFLIANDAELVLEPGVTFYIQKDKSIYVAGSIKSNGTADEPITFRGSRLDEVYSGLPYDKVAGQWGVISLQSISYDNEFTHTSIRNALVGLYVDSLSVNSNPKAKLANCRIENMTSGAIYGINAEVEAENCLFANCEQFVFGASAGGRYDFTNCTFGNYVNRTDESVTLTNYAIVKNTIIPVDLERANFTNCIIYGSNSSEFALAHTYDDVDINAEFNYYFDHCLIKTDLDDIDTTDANFNEVIWNKDPLFIEPSYDWNFYPDTLSPVIDMGMATHLSSDLNDAPYIDAPDIGAFEFAGAKEED